MTGGCLREKPRWVMKTTDFWCWFFSVLHKFFLYHCILELVYIDSFTNGMLNIRAMLSTQKVDLCDMFFALRRYRPQFIGIFAWSNVKPMDQTEIKTNHHSYKLQREKTTNHDKPIHGYMTGFTRWFGPKFSSPKWARPSALAPEWQK